MDNEPDACLMSMRMRIALDRHPGETATTSGDVALLHTTGVIDGPAVSVRLAAAGPTVPPPGNSPRPAALGAVAQRLLPANPHGTVTSVRSPRSYRRGSGTCGGSAPGCRPSTPRSSTR